MTVGGAEVQAAQRVRLQGCLLEGGTDPALQLHCKLRSGDKGVGSSIGGSGP